MYHILLFQRPNVKGNTTILHGIMVIQMETYGVDGALRLVWNEGAHRGGGSEKLVRKSEGQTLLWGGSERAKSPLLTRSPLPIVLQAFGHSTL
jgi:hypothetical protein